MLDGIDKSCDNSITNKGVIAMNHEQINYSRNWQQIGEHVEAYRQEGYKAKFVEALRSPAYAYSRFRPGFITVYHRDAKSPTGVLSAAMCIDIEFAEKAIREIRDNSPLSPTEGLQASGARLY